MLRSWALPLCHCQGYALPRGTCVFLLAFSKMMDPCFFQEQPPASVFHPSFTFPLMDLFALSSKCFFSFLLSSITNLFLFTDHSHPHTQTVKLPWKHSFPQIPCLPLTPRIRCALFSPILKYSPCPALIPHLLLNPFFSNFVILVHQNYSFKVTDDLQLPNLVIGP